MIEDGDSVDTAERGASVTGSGESVAALLVDTDAELVSTDGLPTTRGLIESETPMTATAQTPTAAIVDAIDRTTRVRMRPV